MPCSPPRDLPDPGIKPESLASPVPASRFFPIRATWGFQYQAKILWHLYHAPVCVFSLDPDIKLIYLWAGVAAGRGGASKLCNTGSFLPSNCTRIFKAEPGLPSIGLEPRPSRGKGLTRSPGVALHSATRPLCGGGLRAEPTRALGSRGTGHSPQEEPGSTSHGGRAGRSTCTMDIRLE